jgi:hypothetical protein
MRRNCGQDTETGAQLNDLVHVVVPCVTHLLGQDVDTMAQLRDADADLVHLLDGANAVTGHVDADSVESFLS